MPKIKVTELLGQNFKKFRIENFVKSIDIAKILQKSPAYITKLEKGEIAELDINDFSKMIKYIVGDDMEKFNLALDELLKDTTAILSEDELDNQKWRLNFDTVLREIPIAPALVDFINEKIAENNIDLIDIIRKINSNEDLIDDEYVQSNLQNLSPNHWFINKGEKSCVSILFNLDYAEVLDILTKKTKTCKYYILQALLYNLFKLENMENEQAKQEAIKKLTEHRFLSLEERSKLARKSKSREEYESLLLEIDVENSNLINKIFKYIKILSDLDVTYTSKKLTALEKNFRKDKALTMAFLGIDLTNLQPLLTDTKKEFIQDIEKLINQYSEKAKDCPPELI